MNTADLTEKCLAAKRFAAEVTAAYEAMADRKPDSLEWDAYFALRKRWRKRPSGRAAAPGELFGQERPGERPHGGIKCRRCGGVATMEGHPHGCPQTPHEFTARGFSPLHPCYCGQTLVVTPETFGHCCTGTPPVRVPGGCIWCGSSLCRVNDLGDLPEHNYYTLEVIPPRHPERLPSVGSDLDCWVHPRCIDEYLLARDTEHAAQMVEARRQERQTPLGGIAA